MANPFFIQPASYGAGLAGLGKQLGQMGQQYRQESRQDELMAQQQQQQERVMAAQQKAKDIIMNDGDSRELAMLSIENPELGRSLMAGMKFRDESSKANLMDTYQSIVSGGDVESALTRRANYLAENGIDSEDTLDEIEQYRADPEGYVKQKKAQYTLLDKDYADRVAKGEPEGMTEYQSAMILNKAEENRIRAMENSIKRDQLKIKNETDILKKQQLQDSIDIKKANAERVKKEAIQQAEDGMETVQNTVDTVDRLINHPGLESAAGFQSNFPTLSGTDASDFENTLETLQSQAFLSAVKQMKGMGALSENEGKKLAGSIGAMSTDMSDKALRDELLRIKETLQVAQVKMKNRMTGKAQEKAKPEQTEKPEQATPEGTVIRNPSTGETMIMQGGQWVSQQAQKAKQPTYRGYN